MAFEMTIPNLIKKRAYLTPNRIAFIFEEEEITFSELYENSILVAKSLSGAVRKNDYVAVLLKNHIDTVYILFALQMLGARAVLLNNRLTPNELQWQLEDSNSIMMITEEEFQPIFEKLTGTIYLKHELSNLKAETFHVQEEISLEDICSIMYTSGTTGKPKGVLQTYGNHWWSATGSALNIGLNEHDRWICTVPLFHISGYSILMRSIIYGMTVILYEKFNEEEVLEAIIHNRATVISVVATMVSRLVHKLENQTLPATFRCMLAGGGPISKPLLEACVEKNIPVFQTYGMTETASQVVTLSPEDSLKKLGSAGKPLFPVQLKIVDEKGTEVGPLETGEILVKAPNVTIGYLNQREATENKIKNGWLSTGDIGYLDEEGFLYVMDRRSDLIISGGENIYPAEIEGIIQSHPHVIDAGVIGKKDELWGEVPLAFVVKKVDSLLTDQEVIEYCKEKLAKFKVPKQVIFIEELPRNAAKKLMRHKLREWWEEKQ
jgi:o-succinylbenzoate---CoA ligase